MPIDYKKYPSNWKTEIRPRILNRAKNKCECCGLKNHSIGYRDNQGVFIECKKWAYDEMKFTPEGFKIIKVVITIAHLDHDETNHQVSDDRLKAMCQRCHLRYDAKENASRRKLKKQINH